jgi:hypothetical protein
VDRCGFDDIEGVEHRPGLGLVSLPYDRAHKFDEFGVHYKLKGTYP